MSKMPIDRFSSFMGSSDSRVRDILVRQAVRIYTSAEVPVIEPEAGRGSAPTSFFADGRRSPCPTGWEGQ